MGIASIALGFLALVWTHGIVGLLVGAALIGLLVLAMPRK
jgi:hypothetical protein